MANCRGLNSCPCHFNPFEVHYTVIVQTLSRYSSHSPARVRNGNFGLLKGVVLELNQA